MDDAAELTTRRSVRARTFWAVWFVGFLTWTYLLVVPAEWLPPWLRMGKGPAVGGFNLRKLGHSAAYATLMAYPFLTPFGRRRWKVIGAVLVLHAGATEVIQRFVPTRSGELLDVGIDSFGILVGLLVGPPLGRLCDRGLGAAGAGGGRPEGVAAAPEAEGGARREDAQADPL